MKTRCEECGVELEFSEVYTGDDGVFLCCGCFDDMEYEEEYDE